MNDASWRTLRSSTVIALTGATLAGSARPSALGAQHEAHGAAPKPVAARLGDISFANSGAPAAQPAFVRGLALLHNFQYPQAAAAFRQALALRPDLAQARTDLTALLQQASRPDARPALHRDSA